MEECTMSKQRNEWLTCIKDIAFAALASAGVFVGLSMIIVAVLKEFDPAIREIMMDALITVPYAVFFYRFHMRDRLDAYAEHTDKFDVKKELLAYLRSEGKIMLTIYGACAVVSEISGWLIPNTPQNPIKFPAMLCMGPLVSIPLPIVGSLLAFVYSSVVVCALALIRSRKVYLEAGQRKRGR